MNPAVTFLVPVFDGAATLEEALASIVSQRFEGSMEIVVVDDQSRDETPLVLERWCSRQRQTRVLSGSGRGAAAALELGRGAARAPWIAQVDQDVVLDEEWLPRLLAAAAPDDVAAVQGTWRTPRTAPLWDRVAGLDLETRYGGGELAETDHVSTGNTLYRSSALQQVGGFDPSLGYGYDNDLSYRLREAGFRLLRCRRARSVHRWSPTLRGYLRQQYGQGYGRLDLISRHPRRLAGDRVSGLRMILHVPALILSLLAILGGGAAGLSGRDPSSLFAIASMLLVLLVVDRTAFALSAWRRHRDPASWLLIPAHLLRDAAWVLAVTFWVLRKLLGVPPSTQHSMPRGRDGGPQKRRRSSPSAAAGEGSSSADPSYPAQSPSDGESEAKGKEISHG